MSNLEKTYGAQGNYKQAEARYAQALENLLRVLGPEHIPSLVWGPPCIGSLRCSRPRCRDDAERHRDARIQYRLKKPWDT